MAPALLQGGGGGDILPAVCGQIGNPNCGGGSRGVVAGGRMGHHNGGRKTATRRSRRGGRAGTNHPHLGMSGGGGTGRMKYLGYGGRKTASRRVRRKCRGGSFHMPAMELHWPSF